MLDLSVDLGFYLSGAVSDGQAQSDPALSLGGYRSSVAMNTGEGLSLNNLFTNFPVDNYVNGVTKYKAFFIKNIAGTGETMSDLRLFATLQPYYLDDQNNPALIDGYTLRLGIEAPSAQNTGYIQSIADDETAPVGVSFSAPVSWETSTLVAGNLTIGDIYGVWVEFTLGPNANIPDGKTLLLGIDIGCGSLSA